MPKSWKEKLNSKNEAKDEILEKPMMGMPGGTRLFIAHPLMVKACIEAIPRGETRTIPQMREEMARANDADQTCPLTSGIFVRIASEAALDERRDGASLDTISPFWRIVSRNLR